MPTSVKSKEVSTGAHGACEMIGGCHLLAPGVLKLNAEWRSGSNPCSRAGVKNTESRLRVLQERHTCRNLARRMRQSVFSLLP